MREVGVLSRHDEKHMIIFEKFLDWNEVSSDTSLYWLCCECTSVRMEKHEAEYDSVSTYGI